MSVLAGTEILSSYSHAGRLSYKQTRDTHDTVGINVGMVHGRLGRHIGD